MTVRKFPQRSYKTWARGITTNVCWKLGVKSRLLDVPARTLGVECRMLDSPGFDNTLFVTANAYDLAGHLRSSAVQHFGSLGQRRQRRV